MSVRRRIRQTSKSEMELAMYSMSMVYKKIDKKEMSQPEEIKIKSTRRACAAGNVRIQSSHSDHDKAAIEDLYTVVR
jgi:hypothetical protein